MFTTFAYATSVKCDYCCTAKATVDAKNEIGRKVEIKGHKPNAAGWLLYPAGPNHPGLHLCPDCLAIFYKLKKK